MKSYQELLVLREVHTIKIRDRRFDARNNLCQWLNRCKNAPETVLRTRDYEKEKFTFWAKSGLNLKQGTEKLKRWFYPGDMVTRTGDREIGVVSVRLPDNPGDRRLAYMPLDKSISRD